MWGVLETFLRDEKYVERNQTQEDIAQAVKLLVQNHDWSVNPQGKMAALYLIGKAKSLLKGTWLWRPIAALPQPILPKRDLKVAARATTTMLRLI